MVGPLECYVWNASHASAKPSPSLVLYKEESYRSAADCDIAEFEDIVVWALNQMTRNSSQCSRWLIVIDRCS